MEIFILVCLSACILMFMVTASVHLIGVEKKIEETVRRVERKIREMYEE